MPLLSFVKLLSFVGGKQANFTLAALQYLSASALCAVRHPSHLTPKPLDVISSLTLNSVTLKSVTLNSVTLNSVPLP